MCRAIFAVAVVATLAGPAVAADLASLKLVEPGALTYGIAAGFPPFEFVKDGKITGFDVDLFAAMSQKLSLKAVPVNMDFAGLIPALQGGRLDLINAAMYINPKRSEQVDFVPYLKIGNQMLVQRGNPAKITGRDDSICGKTIAVTLGAVDEGYAREDAKRCEAAKLGPVKVLTFPSEQDAALNLRQGHADAYYDSTPGAVELVAKLPDSLEMAGPEFESNTQVGFAFRKGDEAVKAAIVSALHDIVADGTYRSMINAWHFPPSVAYFD